MPAKNDIIQTSLEHLIPNIEQVTKTFFTNLFNREPDLEVIFLQTDWAALQNALAKVFGLVVANLENPEFLESYLYEVGRKHQALGIKKEHLPLALDALMFAVRDSSGPVWTHELEAAWTDMTVMLLDYMQRGMGAATSTTPVR